MAPPRPLITARDKKYRVDDGRVWNKHDDYRIVSVQSLCHPHLRNIAVAESLRTTADRRIFQHRWVNRFVYHTLYVRSVTAFMSPSMSVTSLCTLWLYNIVALPHSHHTVLDYSWLKICCARLDYYSFGVHRIAVFKRACQYVSHKTCPKVPMRMPDRMRRLLSSYQTYWQSIYGCICIHSVFMNFTTYLEWLSILINVTLK